MPVREIDQIGVVDELAVADAEARGERANVTRVSTLVWCS